MYSFGTLCPNCGVKPKWYNKSSLAQNWNMTIKDQRLRTPIGSLIVCLYMSSWKCFHENFSKLLFATNAVLNLKNTECLSSPFFKILSSKWPCRFANWGLDEDYRSICNKKGFYKFFLQLCCLAEKIQVKYRRNTTNLTTQLSIRFFS